ncbi:MAG: PEP-CTERM sorting domain-containing protein [Gammaproteobacteria bacterium]|nr:PEP-CTERM sorting domain-containing protein [Gammaproteobacteria bacterium]
MKGLRARVGGCFSLDSVAAITLLWASALGQATPDSATVPEPSVLPLLGAGVIAAWLVSRRRK